MTYSSHINAQDALGYSKWATGFGMTQELCITGYVGSTKPRRRTHDRLGTNHDDLCEKLPAPIRRGIHDQRGVYGKANRTSLRAVATRPLLCAVAQG